MGWAVKGWDGIRKAITGEGREIEKLKTEATLASAALSKLNDERRKLMESAREGAGKAWAELGLTGGPDAASNKFMQPQKTLGAELADIMKKREAAKLGIGGGQVGADLAIQETNDCEKQNQAYFLATRALPRFSDSSHSEPVRNAPAPQSQPFDSHPELYTPH